MNKSQTNRNNIAYTNKGRNAMSFLGIITNQKNETYMRRKLINCFSESNIIFITDRNIMNIKNIRFEIILIDSSIRNIEMLKHIISNTQYVILNSDLLSKFRILEDFNLIVITYGFNNKSTFTISSIEDNKIIICLQRIIKNIRERKYEPQEFWIEKSENTETSAIIGTKIVELMCEK